MNAPAKTKGREGFARIPSEGLEKHERRFLDELDSHLPRLGKNGHGFSLHTLDFAHGDCTADFGSTYFERIQSSIESADYADLGRAYVENYIVHIGQSMEVEIDEQEALSLAEKEGYLK